MKLECEHMKTRPLYQTNQEIMVEIMDSHNERRELNQPLAWIKHSDTEMKRAHASLQEKHTVLKKRMEKRKIRCNFPDVSMVDISVQRRSSTM